MSSLVDALLLDPYNVCGTVNVWLAPRTDGVGGSGTPSDPFNASAERFDQVMAQLTANWPERGLRIHLLPGRCKTRGFCDGDSSPDRWEVKPRMKLVGSGIDATTPNLDGRSEAQANAHYCAIGHALARGTPADFCEVCELTIQLPVGSERGHNADCLRRSAPDRRSGVLAAGAGRATLVLKADTLPAVDDLVAARRQKLPPADPSPFKAQIEQEIAALERRLTQLRQAVGVG